MEVAKALVAAGMVAAVVVMTVLEVVEVMARATAAEPRDWVVEWKVVAVLEAAMAVAAMVVERAEVEEARRRSQGGDAAAVAPHAAPPQCSSRL